MHSDAATSSYLAAHPHASVTPSRIFPLPFSARVRFSHAFDDTFLYIVGITVDAALRRVCSCGATRSSTSA